MKRIIILMGLLILFIAGCTQPEPEQITPTNLTNETIVEPIIDMTLNYDDLTIHWLDTEGEAYFVSYHGYNILIDTGRVTDSQKIIKKLNALNVERLNKIIITNNHPDRKGTAVYMWLRFKPEEVIDNGLIVDSNYQLLNSTSIGQDELIQLKDDLYARLIIPYDYGEGFQGGLGEDSIIVKLIHPTAKILFASDCNEICYDWTTDANLNSDILFASDYNSIGTLGRIRPLKVFGTNELFTSLDYEVYGKGSTIIINNGVEVK